MKLLITGASGLLGLNLAVEAARSHQVVGTDRGRLMSAPFEVLHADLLEPGAADRMMDQAQPDAVINCAAIANVDQCEADPDLARRVNAEVPERIAAACASLGTRLIQISTDAVFDGTKPGSYVETDDPAPAGVYAATKCAGESSVLRVNPGAIVARVNFYGWSLSGQRSLAEFFVNNLSNGKAVDGFTDVVFCPMYVRHLADTLVRMLQANLHGIYHVVGPKRMSKFAFGVAIARTFGFADNLISPRSVEQSRLVAPRAHNLDLCIHKLSTDLQQAVPDFFTGLAEFYSEYQQGYPQRIRSYQHRPAVDGEEVPRPTAPSTTGSNGSRHGY